MSSDSPTDRPDEAAAPPGAATLLLRRAASGDGRAHEELLTLLYGELKAIAGAHMRRERAGHSLQPTAVVHEAWLRLVGEDDRQFQSRTEFLATAATVMRHVLVDHARARRAAKRGGDLVRVTLSELGGSSSGEDQAALVLAVHSALDELKELHEQQAQVVELRWFGGLTVPEVSEHLGIAPRTVEKYWTIAKGWLRLRLQDRTDDEG